MKYDTANREGVFG